MKKKILSYCICSFAAFAVLSGANSLIAKAAVTPGAISTPTPAPVATPVPGPVVTFKEAFPDGNFRGYLNEKVLSVKLGDSDKVTAEVQTELAFYTGDLDLTRQGIADLTGISYLKGIKSLKVDNNSLTTLALKDFENLETISASHNRLITVTLSNLPKLKSINFDYNRLAVFDISLLTSLEEVSCASNNIATMNIAKLTSLTSLNVRDNSLLLLDVSTNKELTFLNAENNHLAVLDIKALSKLKSFYADGNELVNFDKTGFNKDAFSNFELQKSALTLTGVALGTQYGVILPANAAVPNANSISASGTYLAATRSIVWSSLTKVPTTFTYQYTITGSTDVVTVTVFVDKSTMVKDALTVGTPMNFALADYSYNKLKLTWSAVNGASGYRIYRSATKTGTYKLVKTITSGTTVSYINSGLTCGSTYYYKIRAFREVNGVKYFGSYASIISRKAKPAKPTITLSKYSSKKIKISWKQKAGASGYVIYRATSKKGKYSKIKTITSGKTVKYINTKRKKGKTYYYKMRTYRTVNGKKIYSAYSSIKSKRL
ncbi:MAG: hypothetical protein J6I65_02020 [Lachnospiraceae bacterium]|nr:hypothetical protein [Lachnospiraceae bacterium]